MYGAGRAIRSTDISVRRRGRRQLGRWVAMGILLASAWMALARVALGGIDATSTVVVEPGDTLWSIAAARYPDDDVRARVDQIERLNGLQGPLIKVGETLRLPA